MRGRADIARLRAMLVVFSLLSALGVASLLFTGCFRNDAVAGGDDYPNSVTTLGRVAAEENADTTEWNGWKAAPGTPPGVYDSTYVPQSEPPMSADTGLLKRGLDEGVFLLPGGFVPGLDMLGALRIVDTLLPDPVGGERRIVRVQSATLFTARDTTWSAPGPYGHREVRRVSGRLEMADGGYRAFTFEDDDGDSALAPRPGAANHARIRMTVSDPSGRVEETLLRVAAGPDLDFNGRQDNALLQLQTIVRQGTDTLVNRVLKSADGGDVIYDPQRDSNRVEVEQETLRDDGSREQVFYIAVVFPDSGRNYSARYRKVLTTDAGVTETILLGRDSLPDFAPGDTGRARTVFESSVASDTLKRSETLFRVRLADTAGRHDANRLLRIESHKVFRFGARKSTRYVLIPPAPISNGIRTRRGSLEVRVDLRPSGWIEYSGTVSDTGFTGVWTSTRGRSGVVHFDTSGTRVTAPGP